MLECLTNMAVLPDWHHLLVPLLPRLLATLDTPHPALRLQAWLDTKITCTIWRIRHEITWTIWRSILPIWHEITCTKYVTDLIRKLRYQVPVKILYTLANYVIDLTRNYLYNSEQFGELCNRFDTKLSVQFGELCCRYDTKIPRPIPPDRTQKLPV